MSNGWLLSNSSTTLAFEELKMAYPKTTSKRRRELLSIRKQLKSS